MPSAQHDIVERMRSVTHHLTAMIEEILTFSSLEAGRELVRPVPSDVPEVVAAASAIAAPLAGLKAIDFGVSVAADVPRIVTDPDKVRQILVNLLGNAIKFTERGTVRIDVTVDAPGTPRRQVCFAVCDSGIGIAHDDLAKLFHPFTQLDVGLTRRFGGTGLGLYIAQQLATLLGGRIDVKSEVGAGSTFTLALPVER